MSELGMNVGENMEMPRPETRRKDLANLNALRTFAVTVVLIDHGATLLGNRGVIHSSLFWSDLGFIGVMAFFVHTSLVLMHSLDRLPDHRKAIAFYIRRIFRIYPLSIFCVLLVVILKIPIEPMTSGTFQSPSLIVLTANLLLIQNLVGHWSVSTPMWSLPYEVEMYVVLPLLHKIANSRRAVSYLIGLIVAFSLIGWVVLKKTAHLNILGVIPCFLSGVLAYTLRGQRPFLPSSLWPLFLVLWMTLGPMATVAYRDVSYPILWLSTFILGIGVYCFHDSTNRPWNTAAEVVAKYSYGIYLGHVPVMWLVFWVLPVYNMFASVLIWLIGTVAVAVAAYHLLEEPMINLGKKIANLMSPSRMPTSAPKNDWQSDGTPP